MPTTMPGREKVKKYLNENHIKIASLAKAYGLSRQVATDYISGRIQSPQSNKFILKVIEDLDLQEEYIMEENKNFYRPFNAPIKKHIDWEAIGGAVLLILMILVFSLVSYDFWDAIVNIFGR